MAPLRILELELHVQLHAAGRQRRHRVSEKWGGNDSYISHVVDMIKHVERIQSHGQRARLLCEISKAQSHVQGLGPVRSFLAPAWYCATHRPDGR